MIGFLALIGSAAPPRPGGSALHGVEVWEGGPVRLLATRTDRPNGPRLAERGPYVAAGDLRLDNRADLRRALRADGDDGGLLLAAYERWGEGFLDHLEGPFSFALWDGRAGRLHVARDGVGLRPLYRARLGAGWAFGSHLPTVQSLVPFRVDPAAAADYLAGDTSHPTRTLTDGVERVARGSAGRVDPDGTYRERSFWSLTPPAELPDDDGVVEAAFRDAFDRAVQARLDDDIGAFLSGGLDSSSIVVTARALRPAPPLPTFSLVYDERGADEREFVDAVVDGGGLLPHRVDGAATSILGGLDADLDAVGEPFEAPNLFLTRTLYDRVQQAGLRSVLDGFGGDSVVTHGEQRMTELAFGLRWSTFAREALAVAARTRRPRRMVVNLLRDFVAAPLVAPLRSAVPAVHFGHPDPAGPRSGRRRVHWTARAAQHADLSSFVAPRALEAAFATATARGIEPRFPFYDRRVLDVCLAVPSAQRVRHGLTRSFLRRAMADRLPAEVSDRFGKARLHNNFVASLFERDPDVLRRAVYDDASAAQDVLDVAALQAAYERAERDPSTRSEIAAPLWRAVALARWMATAPGRSASPPEEAALLSSPPAPAGVL